jgi:hypothetical protein
MRYPRAWFLGSVLSLGLALCGNGCGSGLQEGVPSNIDPNRPPPEVTDRLKAAAAVGEQAAARRAESKGKKGTGAPADITPKKLRE